MIAFRERAPPPLPKACADKEGSGYFSRVNDELKWVGSEIPWSQREPLVWTYEPPAREVWFALKDCWPNKILRTIVTRWKAVVEIKVAGSKEITLWYCGRRPARNWWWTHYRGKKKRATEGLSIGTQELAQVLLALRQWHQSAEPGPLGLPLMPSPGQVVRKPGQTRGRPIMTFLPFVFSLLILQCIILLCNTRYVQRSVWHICVCYETQAFENLHLPLCGFFASKEFTHISLKI